MTATGPSLPATSAALGLLLGATLPASAFEGQGAAGAPATDDHPATTVSAPTGPMAGSWSAQGGLQVVGAPLVRLQDDGEGLAEQCVVCTVVGLTAAGQVALGDAFAIGLTVPTYPWVADGEGGAPALGDVVLWAPITLLRSEGGGVAVRPFVSLPTGPAARFLGEGSLGGGALVTGGAGVGPVRVAGELGVDVADRDVLGAVVLQDGLGLWVDVAEGLSVGPELRGRIPLGGVPSAQELGLATRLTLGETLSLRAAGGRGLSDAPGAPAWRGQLSLAYRPTPRVSEARLVAAQDTVDYVFHDSDGRPLREVDVVLRGAAIGTTDHDGVVALPRALRWRDGPLARAPGYQLTSVPPPAVDADSVEVELPWEPVPVQVRVVDATGALLDASIRLEGGGSVEPPLRDDVGTFTYDVPVGVWTLTTEAEGFSPQQRTLVIQGGRTDAMRVDAVMTRASDGVGSLVVTVTDPDGDPVEGALVRLGDDIFGTTGSGGDLTVSQLAEGTRELEVRAEAFEAEAPAEVTIRGDSARPVVMLTHLPGSVEVRVTGPGGTPTPATVEVYSDDASLRPVDTGNDGRHVWVLGEGAWTVGITSAGLGRQQRSIVVDHSERSLQRVDVQLLPALGPASLTVRALDANGRVVPGAEVRLGERSLGTTGSDGALRVDGLSAGDTVLRITAPRVRPYEQSVRLSAARRDVDALLEWLPGTVRVRALGPDGAPVAGEVRATDGATTVKGRFDIDGRWIDQLPPGSWQVLASVEGLGLQTRSIVVEPDRTTLLTIDFRLAEVDGDGSVALTLLRPDGSPIEGARVTIDGQDFGTTGSGGSVRIASLAAGRRTVVATAEGHEAVELVVALGRHEVTETVTMPWAEGVVSVRVLQGERPVTDAVLRLAGPRVVDPVGTDAEGEARLALAPGQWTLLVSSVRAGLHQEQLEVPPGAKLTSWTVSLEQVGTSTLLVRVYDEDGAPVQGATVQLEPGPTATTSAGGAALLTSLVPGPSVLAVDAPDPLVDRTLPVAVGEGSEQLTIEALWPRTPVTVRTTDDTGQRVQADVLLQGAGLLPVQRTDQGGEAVVPLRPGAWRAWGRAGSLEGTRGFEVVLEEAAVVDLSLAEPSLDLSDGRLRFDESVLFDVGSSELKQEAMAEVEALSARLRADPTIVQAEVQGHTDDTGTLAVNMRLSEARARTVLEALVTQGVPRERLRARGFAMLRPVAVGTDEEARAANRRVEVVVTEQAAR